MYARSSHRRNVVATCIVHRACRDRAAARCIVRPGQGEDISVTLYTYNYGVAFRWCGVYVGGANGGTTTTTTERG